MDFMNRVVIPDVLLSESRSFPNLLRTGQSFIIGIFAHWLQAGRPVDYLVRSIC